MAPRSVVVDNFDIVGVPCTARPRNRATPQPHLPRRVLLLVVRLEFRAALLDGAPPRLVLDVPLHGAAEGGAGISSAAEPHRLDFRHFDRGAAIVAPPGAGALDRGTGVVLPPPRLLGCRTVLAL